MDVKVTTADPTEYEDFEAVIRKADRDISDFELTQSLDDYPTAGIWPVTGKVTVRSTKTGTAITYKFGPGTAWVVDFERDLQAGMFN